MVCIAVENVFAIVSGMLSMKLDMVVMVRLVEIGFEVDITKSVLAPKTGVTVIGLLVSNFAFHCGNKVKDGVIGF